MAKIDELKEELNYLKVWLGIIVITTKIKSLKDL